MKTARIMTRKLNKTAVMNTRVGSAFVRLKGSGI